MPASPLLALVDLTLPNARVYFLMGPNAIQRTSNDVPDDGFTRLILGAVVIVW